MTGEMGPQANTFAIVAHCSQTGQLRIAISTAIPGAGGLCPFLRATIRAVSTQSWVHPYLAFYILYTLNSRLPSFSALVQAIHAPETQ